MEQRAKGDAGPRFPIGELGSDRIDFFRLRFAPSRVRRKNKVAPNLGHRNVGQRQTVRDLVSRCPARKAVLQIAVSASRSAWDFT